MNNKVKWSLIGAAVLLVANAFISWGTGGKLGATWAGGVSHTNSQFDAVGGFSVNGNVVISSSTVASSTGLVLSGGTQITTYSCATRGTVLVPAITGGKTASEDMAVTTSVTLTGIANGDVLIANWNPGYTTGTLQDYKLTMTANASGTNAAIVTFTNYGANTSTAMVAPGGTIKVCYIH